MHQPPADVIILGVCASGKSTLASRLTLDGLRVRTVAQEHSIIPDLWRWSQARAVVYLHASYAAVKSRRNSLMHRANYDAQLERLREAREHATVRVDTSQLSADQVYDAVRRELDRDTDRSTPPPVADEPGSDIQPSQPVPAPVPDEPGERQSAAGYSGLPVPEEL